MIVILIGVEHRNMGVATYGTVKKLMQISNDNKYRKSI